MPTAATEYQTEHMATFMQAFGETLQDAISSLDDDEVADAREKLESTLAWIRRAMWPDPRRLN